MDPATLTLTILAALAVIVVGIHVWLVLIPHIRLRHTHPDEPEAVWHCPHCHITIPVPLDRALVLVADPIDVEAHLLTHERTTP